MAERRFLAERFHIEAVVTSHDPARPNFSENTAIHESLLICGRASSWTRNSLTLRWVSNGRRDSSPCKTAICWAPQAGVFGTPFVRWRRMATCRYSGAAQRICGSRWRLRRNSRWSTRNRRLRRVTGDRRGMSCSRPSSTHCQVGCLRSSATVQPWVRCGFPSKCPQKTWKRRKRSAHGATAPLARSDS